MAEEPRREPDPDLEDIRELGLVESRRRKAPPTRGARTLIWLLPLAILAVAAVALVASLR